MTRNRRGNRLPIERWTRDCLDVRFLKREGFLDGSWVAIGPSLRWPRIAHMRIARYLLILDLQGSHSVPQHIRASWTRLHFGGDRPRLHCPHCERRVAKLYRGLAGYFCRACVGNPPYATELLSAGGRAHFKSLQTSISFSMARRSFHGRFQGVRHGCIGAPYQRLRREGMNS